MTKTLETGLTSCSRRERRQNIAHRLSRIEGQVRGLQRMIEDDRYCIDVITQTKAVGAALKRVEAELLKDHTAHCLAEALGSADTAQRDIKIAELVNLLQKNLS